MSGVETSDEMFVVCQQGFVLWKKLKVLRAMSDMGSRYD
jgi:hypothetical protein